ncbi:MAG: hypothetical protein ACJAQ9_000091 [Ilumatobacter sp.]|jgi:hypothetical protein
MNERTVAVSTVKTGVVLAAPRLDVRRILNL